MAKTSKYDALDRVFSQFIRLRDADNDGYCICCSSGVRVHWEECDAGHFISRRHLSTRWCEMNVHAQSRYDNRFNQGNAHGYAQFMLNRYGPTVFDDLERLKNTTRKYTKLELKIMADNYKHKIKQLKKEKGL